MVYELEFERTAIRSTGGLEKKGRHIHSSPLRTLSAKWTVELERDLKIRHNIDLESEMEKILEDEL